MKDASGKNVEGREGERKSQTGKRSAREREENMMRRCWNYGSRTDSDTSLRRTLSCIEQSPRITERREETRDVYQSGARDKRRENRERGRESD